MEKNKDNVFVKRNTPYRAPAKSRLAEGGYSTPTKSGLQERGYSTPVQSGLQEGGYSTPVQSGLQEGGYSTPVKSRLAEGGYGAPEIPQRMRGGTAGSAGAKLVGSIEYLSKIMEDRQNDWLARQLAYERSIKYSMGGMLKNRR